MIISVSRRTDIPAYYSEWFMNRIKEQYVLVRNPMNPHQVSRISLSPDVVDGIVFWTKNPLPMMDKLDGLKDYPYYFQFTLNSYGKDIEANIPPKNHVMLSAFQKLANKIGKERIVWRYDPILFNDRYTFDYHVKSFQMIASQLCGCTEQCIVSFVDRYRSTERNAKSLNLIQPDAEQETELMRNFSAIAIENGLLLATCAENMDLSALNIRPAHCIDKDRLERLCGCRLNLEKDKNQRKECGCAESIDVGMYNTCGNGCLYCYANYNPALVQKHFQGHNPISPFICGEIGEGDVIKEREVHSCKDCQLNFFSV